MEGVEDIPGIALSEGITWDWETLPEYMDALDAKPHSIDFAVQVTHDPLRVYVMGDRAVCNEQATETDIAAMRKLTREALEAGAIGFSTGRSDIHRSADGEWTPSSEATAEELSGIANAFKGLSHGVLQAVNDFDLEREGDAFDKEFDILEAMAAGGRRASVFPVAHATRLRAGSVATHHRARRKSRRQRHHHAPANRAPRHWGDHGSAMHLSSIHRFSKLQGDLRSAAGRARGAHAGPWLQKAAPV